MIDPVNPDYSMTPASSQRPPYAPRLADPSALPVISVITPYFNEGEIFHETAHSLLRQTLQQWEWIIVNDGSTDDASLKILDTYRDRDPRIRILDHQRNAGPAAARNTGFASARAAFVFQLDSDNLIEPTAIEKCYWFLESHPEYAFVKGYTVGFGASEYLWASGFHRGRAFLAENQVDATSMIRRTVHHAVAGYDESIRGGFEDWDFWLRCANGGFWGATIPEYLDWYRRRPTHSDRWADWDNGPRQKALRKRLRQRYSRLFEGGFPQITLPYQAENATVPDELPVPNRLVKKQPRLVMIVPWLALGGADKFNLDLVRELTRCGWDITIATTLAGDHSWLPRFARLTPEIFVLNNFLRLVDFPRFLRYLIHSRQADSVLVSHSELGYLLLPYLRAHCPDVTFWDYCHMEEEYWKSGGYPRMSIVHQESLDLTAVSSEHLKRWLVRRGADPERIRVVYTNIDPEEWHPDDRERAAVRRELKVDDSVPLILYPGRICDQKQPRVFARTILRLHEQGEDFVTLVAGDGPELKWLRSFISNESLSRRVRLLGRIPNERVRQLLTASDIFFLPSRWEGIALSLYEAMACGVAVVGADVGGQRELVTPECGVLVQSGDEEAEATRYADVLTGLLRDPGRCRAMGNAGRDRVVAHFRLDQMRDRIVRFHEDACRLHVTDARPRPPIGLGRACAAQAVEYVRLSRVAHRLWEERNASVWRVAVYRGLVHSFTSRYRWGVARGWNWLVPLGKKIRQTLLRPA